LTFDWIYLTDIKSEVDKELSNKVVSNQLKQVKSLVNATQDVGFKSVIWNVTNSKSQSAGAAPEADSQRWGSPFKPQRSVLAFKNDFALLHNFIPVLSV